MKYQQVKKVFYLEFKVGHVSCKSCMKTTIDYRIVKDGIIPVVYKVRLFYLFVIKQKSDIMSYVYYYESLRFCLYY